MSIGILNSISKTVLDSDAHEDSNLKLSTTIVRVECHLDINIMIVAYRYAYDAPDGDSTIVRTYHTMRDK